MALRLALWLAPMCLLVACSAPFLHSAVGAEQAIADPGMVGEWRLVAEEGDDTQISATVTASPGDIYRVALHIAGKGQTRTDLALDVRLTQIGRGTFADLYLAEAQRKKLADAYGGLAVPVHQLLRYERKEDHLTIWQFDATWLSRTVQSAGVAGEQVLIGGGGTTLVTAPTEAIRTLIEKHADSDQAFHDPMVFRRVK